MSLIPLLKEVNNENKTYTQRMARHNIRCGHYFGRVLCLVPSGCMMSDTRPTSETEVERLELVLLDMSRHETLTWDYLIELVELEAITERNEQ